MKQDITKFVCDKCKTTVERVDDIAGGYNLFKGWHHAQITHNLGSNDKFDFCSARCLVEFFQEKKASRGRG